MNRSLITHAKTGWYWAACAAACLLAGCAQHDTGAGAPTTQPVAIIVPEPVYDFVEVQAANGALEDATLYRGHFTGDQLNSLGRAKLALLARARETGQHVTIYVDSPDGADVPAARRDAITAYLAHAGIASGDLEVKAGPDADNTYSAAAAILGLQKTDSDYQSQQSSGSMSGSPGGYGGSGGYSGSNGAGSGK